MVMASAPPDVARPALREFASAPPDVARPALRRRLVLTMAAAGLALAAAAPVSAQQSPVRLIVGAVAGGAIDPYARVIAEHMARTLGQPVIVENKPGANGN